MTRNSTDRQLVWVVLAIVAALFVLPMFAMGFGVMGMGPTMGDHTHHDTWDANDGAADWLFVVGAVFQLLFLAVVVGAGYLAYRALTDGDDATDPAMEELRTAYARGEIDDEEFERRRERLESER
jgi:putative membrane protein